MPCRRQYGHFWRPFVTSSRSVEPIAPPAEVPEREAKERDGELEIRDLLATFRETVVRRLTEVVDVQQPLQSPLLDTKLSQVDVARIVIATVALVPVVETGGEHRCTVWYGDHRADAERRDEMAPANGTARHRRRRAGSWSLSRRGTQRLRCEVTAEPTKRVEQPRGSRSFPRAGSAVSPVRGMRPFDPAPALPLAVPSLENLLKIVPFGGIYDADPRQEEFLSRGDQIVWHRSRSCALQA